MGISAIEDDLLDDCTLPIRQFLGHAQKLGIEDTQEKGLRMGICVRVRLNPLDEGSGKVPFTILFLAAGAADWPKEYEATVASARCGQVQCPRKGPD